MTKFTIPSLPDDGDVRIPDGAMHVVPEVPTPEQARQEWVEWFAQVDPVAAEAEDRS